MSVLTPIDPELWSSDAEPHLMGGKLPSGEIVFPMPQGDAAEGSHAAIRDDAAAAVGEQRHWQGRHRRVPRSCLRPVLPLSAWR